MENVQPTFAVTFGRFNLPHPGHVNLIARMLEIADKAYVGISVAHKNNDYITRREVLHSLCGFAGLDLERIRFFPASTPFETVEDFVQCYNNSVTVVLGVDQTQLGEKLRDTFNVAFVPNEVRVGSSTVIRYFLEEGDEQIVREIYHDSPALFDKVLTLRNEELDRDRKVS
jgi:cytidyltransferase-like protein